MRKIRDNGYKDGEGEGSSPSLIEIRVKNHPDHSFVAPQALRNEEYLKMIAEIIYLIEFKGIDKKHRELKQQY